MPSQRLSRRSMVRGIVVAGSSLALGPLLAACGGGAATQPTTAPGASGAPAPTSAPAATTAGTSAASPTAAATAAAATNATPAAASSSTGQYKGKFVIVSLRTLQQGRGMAKLEDDFAKAHPGVEITHTSFPSEKFVALFTAMQNSGEQVDVLDLNGQDLRRYATGGQLVELNELAQEIRTRFEKIGLDTYTIGGKLWALPFGEIGGFPLLYNKALLDRYQLKEPTTYDDLVAIGKTLQKNGASALTHSGKNIYLWPVWFFSTYGQTSGNQAFDKTVKTLTGQLKFTDPEVQAGLDAIFKMSQDGLFSPGMLSNDTDGAQAELFNGKAAFWLQYDGLIAAVADTKPKDFSLGVEEPVQFVSGSVKRNWPGGTGSALGIYTKSAPALRNVAWSFLDFVTRDDNVTYLVQDGKGIITCNVNAKASDDPVATTLKGFVADMTIYLDWFWPPEITRAFQEGIQAGVAKQKDAKQVSQDIQSVFDGLVQKGYTFQL
jgi:raffinose/stachyose/melibiose transport system substrate-binding protein